MSKTATAVKTAKAKSTTTKVSAYKTNVLTTNKALRQECKTLGGAVSILWFFRKEIGLSSQYCKIIAAIRKDKVIYNAFKDNCRISKAGNYAPFFVLQAIHKSLKK